MSPLRQHSLKLNTQSLQFWGRVYVPVYSYRSTPGFVPPLHVLNADGQSGDISTPGPVTVKTVELANEQFIDDMSMVT